MTSNDDLAAKIEDLEAEVHVLRESISWLHWIAADMLNPAMQSSSLIVWRDFAYEVAEEASNLGCPPVERQ